MVPLCFSRRAGCCCRFSSAECASTDLCDLARKVEGILSKFQ